MAVNTNKRHAVKHVRDKAKAAYEKQPECYICSTPNELELHHFYSLTLLLDSWARKKKYDISTDEGILAVRDEFISEHHDHLYNKVRTLCNKHHVALHKVYGKSPPLGTEKAQEKWVDIQKSKYNGEAPPASSFGSFFSEFI